MKHEHHKSRFHDHEHAVEFDRRAARSGIRAELEKRLMDILALKGDELVLDLATGTGRFARPVAKRLLKEGRVIGIDQALAMLRVGHEHEDPIPGYSQTAGDAEALPFKADTFDRAFVSFSLHHFGRPAMVAFFCFIIFPAPAPILIDSRICLSETPRRYMGSSQ